MKTLWLMAGLALTGLMRLALGSMLASALLVLGTALAPMVVG